MKAILVVDMPVSCTQCRFRDVDGCSVDDCAKSNDGSLVIDRYIYDLKRHGSCPLKPMPQELPTPYMMRQIMIADGIQKEKPPYTEEYQKGYNDCIVEILGEEDD